MILIGGKLDLPLLLPFLQFDKRKKYTAGIALRDADRATSLRVALIQQ
jgi:hypothetical protein